MPVDTGKNLPVYEDFEVLDYLLSEEFRLLLSVGLVLAIGVLAWTVYRNTRAVRSCNRQACLAFASEVYGEIATDPKLASLFRRGLNDFKTLSPDDKVRMHYFLQSTVGLFRDSFNAYNEKVISHEEYETNRAAAMAVLQMPGGKVWWRDAQNAYPQELRLELNAKGDLSYALGDIYPYFLLAQDEPATQDGALDGSSDANSQDDELAPIKNAMTVKENRFAANEDILGTVATPATDWRRGLARKRARQNFVSR